MYWFIPVLSGDVRLEAAENGSVLTLHNPTQSELELLEGFWKVAKEKGWLSRKPRIKKKGDSAVVLHGEMKDTGPALTSILHGPAETWTALRFASGRVEVIDGRELPEMEAMKNLAKDGKQLPAKKDEVTAVASVKRPARGCPAPEPCSYRASQVLKAFCTQSQWRDWTTRGQMTCIGNDSGEAFIVHHRDKAARMGLGHSVTKARSGQEICVWDATVPAEEEALAAKFAIEHRERWLMSHPGVRGFLPR